jgi:hypothetical protein
MSVASPYAVFRASDLGWPPVWAVAASERPAQAGAIKPRPRKQRVAGADQRATRQPRWSALVQGELFPLQAQV